MPFTLPVSGKTIEFRDFVPHKVVVEANEALYKGVQIKSQAITPTKEELQGEFGPDVVRELDSLVEAAYEARLAELREEFLRRKVEMEGMTLGNVEQANLCKATGIVKTIDGQPSTKDLIGELPHQDFEFILAKYDEIFEAADVKKNAGQQGK